jgi:hypothetical protein
MQPGPFEGITTKVNGKVIGATYAVYSGKLVVTLDEAVASATDSLSVDFIKAGRYFCAFK